MARRRSTWRPTPPVTAIRAWGRLGYPRRALRLHAAAVECRDRFGGVVPSDVADLRSLPGVGEYTAAAVAAFAFGQRHAVLDTNVRRVHARWLDGCDQPASSTVSSGERRRALELLPIDPLQAARASIAVMELGALVCTSRTPACDAVPSRPTPALGVLPATPWETRAVDEHRPYAGTDRQCRGRLLAVLRNAGDPIAEGCHGRRMARRRTARAGTGQPAHRRPGRSRPAWRLPVARLTATPLLQRQNPTHRRHRSRPSRPGADQGGRGDRAASPSVRS